MGIEILWRAPKVNPINHKAQFIPLLNPVDKYGRTFYFSTFGFMVAFLSWYAFPPLLSITIRADLKLSQTEIANSNVLALTATLLVRAFIGPLCDRYGPRYCFAGVLLAGAIPTAMAGLVTNATGLIILRFFVGILGGSFVPCQVWSTGFYDKSVVGTANALMAGIGNAGGGITYFVMPAIFDSLVQKQHLTPHKAWRVAFIVPFVLITTIALAMLAFGEDTPTGKWSERHLFHEQKQSADGGVVVNTAGRVTDSPASSGASDSSIDEKMSSKDKTLKDPEVADLEIITQAEIVQSPTFKEAMNVIFSLQCLMLAAPYACSFGAELAVNSILGSYYLRNFPRLGQTGSGSWAAMFGILNIVCRPAGGIISDMLYRKTNSVWVKKHWLIFLGTVQGAIFIIIGLLNPHHEGLMFGLFALVAVFMEGANGANFAIVPHVHPFANGILSGVIGAAGNLGGIIFAIIFRFHETRYNQVIWIIGAICIGVNLGVSWIRPIPKGQIGGK
ncbi:hypothetical protein RUND412_005266 [Rhizina undulata]